MEGSIKDDGWVVMEEAAEGQGAPPQEHHSLLGSSEDLLWAIIKYTKGIIYTLIDSGRKETRSCPPIVPARLVLDLRQSRGQCYAYSYF